jgi:hypothetical protein
MTLASVSTPNRTIDAAASMKKSASVPAWRNR